MCSQSPQWKLGQACLPWSLASPQRRAQLGGPHLPPRAWLLLVWLFPLNMGVSVVT